MSTPKRLHTAAVDAAFVHGHVETELECAARERAGDHVREIALMLDAELVDKARAASHARECVSSADLDLMMAHGHVVSARLAEVKVRVLRSVLEFALRSHGRFKAYVEAKRALEACEAPKDA